MDKTPRYRPRQRPFINAANRAWIRQATYADPSETDRDLVRTCVIFALVNEQERTVKLLGWGLHSVAVSMKNKETGTRWWWDRFSKVWRNDASAEILDDMKAQHAWDTDGGASSQVKR